MTDSLIEKDKIALDGYPLPAQAGRLARAAAIATRTDWPYSALVGLFAATAAVLTSPDSTDPGRFVALAAAWTTCVAMGTPSLSALGDPLYIALSGNPRRYRALKKKYCINKKPQKEDSKALIFSQPVADRLVALSRTCAAIGAAFTLAAPCLASAAGLPRSVRMIVWAMTAAMVMKGSVSHYIRWNNVARGAWVIEPRENLRKKVFSVARAKKKRFGILVPEVL